MFSLILHLHRLRLLPSSFSLRFHPSQDEETTPEPMDNPRSYSQVVQYGLGHRSNGQPRLSLQYSAAPVDPGYMETDLRAGDRQPLTHPESSISNREPLTDCDHMNLVPGPTQLTVPLEPQSRDLGTHEVVEVDVTMDSSDEPHPPYPGIPPPDLSKEADVRARLKSALEQLKYYELNYSDLQMNCTKMSDHIEQLQHSNRQMGERLETVGIFNVELQRQNKAMEERMRKVFHENQASRQELETAREHIMRTQYNVERLLPENIHQVFVDMRSYLIEIFEDFTEDITLDQIFKAMQNDKYASRATLRSVLTSVTERNPNLKILVKPLNDLPADFFLTLFMFILWNNFFQADPLYEADLSITAGIICARDGMLKSPNSSPDQIRTWTCQAFQSLFHTAGTNNARVSHTNKLRFIATQILGIFTMPELTLKRPGRAKLDSIVTALFNRVFTPAYKLCKSMLTSSHEYLVEFHVFSCNQEAAVKLMKKLAQDKAVEFVDLARNGRKIEDVGQCRPLCMQTPVVTLIERKKGTQIRRVQVVMKGVVYVESEGKK